VEAESEEKRQIGKAKGKFAKARGEDIAFLPLAISPTRRRARQLASWRYFITSEAFDTPFSLIASMRKK